MLIEFAAEDGLCVPEDQAEVWRLTPPPCTPGQRPAAEALGDLELRDQIERRWSMRDYEADDASIVRTEANDHFFGIFGQIRQANQDLGRLVAGVRSLAAAHGVSYLETSSGWVPDRGARGRLYERPLNPDLLAMRQELLADVEFTTLRDATVEALEVEVQRSEDLLGCAGPSPGPGCGVDVRFQRIAVRNQPPAAVFVQVLLAYEVAQRSKLVVGVNLVAPETGEYALADYALHMRMFGTLAALYPEVALSLHAAEMTDQQAIELDARDHLALAIGSPADGGAGADRIGHGVALDAELEREQVLRRMSDESIAVEINLRSNALLLGVAGEGHPLTDYLEAGVPVVLSTDDAGLMNTDLTEQFVLASGHRDVDYEVLKGFARNSIEYSFLEKDPREQLLRRLERDLEEFERALLVSSVDVAE